MDGGGIARLLAAHGSVTSEPTHVVGTFFSRTLTIVSLLSGANDGNAFGLRARTFALAALHVVVSVADSPNCISFCDPFIWRMPPREDAAKVRTTILERRL